MLRRTVRPTAVRCKIEMSAFAGVLLVLLFALVVRSALPNDLWNPDIDMHRPIHNEVWMLAAERDDALMVTILPYETVYLRDHHVTLPQLTSEIREASGQSSDKTVYIRVAFRVRYWAVAEVLDRVQEAGIQKVGFITQPELPCCTK